MANAPAAAHALQLLNVLAQHANPLPAMAIARALKIPRSSTYHLLAVLAEQGYVTHLADERRYGLGVAVYELGSAYQRQVPLSRVARPLLDRLVDDTTHNAHLAVLHGREVFYVIEQRAPRRPLLVTDVGVRLPAPLTASGLAMLAALPSAQVRALFPHRDTLVRRDGFGPKSVTQLLSILSAVRNRGFALEDGWVSDGMTSVAQSVRDHNGLAVASVAVTYPSGQVSASGRAGLVAAVTATADTLTGRIGGQPPPRR